MKVLQRVIPLLLLVCFISAGFIYCGGGDDEECTDTFISGVYNYSFLNTTNLTIQDGTDSITVSSFFLSGTFDTSMEALTVDTSSSISADSGPLFGSFTASVTQALQIPADSDPTAGQIQVNSGQSTITVTVVSTPSAGVNVSVNGGPDQFFSWADFDPDSLTGGNGTAAFATGSIKVLFRLFELIADAATIIDQNENVFLVSPTVSVPCDTFGSSPDITMNPGSIDFAWTDDGSGEIDFNDSFSLTIDECWDDDTSSRDDDLIDGTANLSDISTAFDDNCKVLSFGFNTVQLQNLVVSDTNSNALAGGTVTIDSSITISGTFSLSFF